MKQYHALYNPLAGNGRGEADAGKLDAIYGAENVIYRDITKIGNFEEFLSEIPLSDDIVICGGDGTLNHFANDVKDLQIGHNILYFACGSGNDFLRDLGKNAFDAPIRVNEYVTGLPSVTVNGEERLFLNGVGYGIDGYCCEIGDRIRRDTPEKKINYAGIAIKGLLFHFKPRRATVTVDGIEKTYEKVWIAPTMNGRYYGGGMMNAPDQDRLCEDGTVSLVLFYGKGKLKTLIAFPSIFKGEHVKKTNMVAVHTGKEISVRFEKPAPLQIDGETVLNVQEYRVTAKAKVPAAEAVPC